MRRTWVPRKMAECHAIKLPAEAHINKEQIQAVARHPHAHITSTIASYNREALAVTGLYEARHDISDTAKLVQGLYERKGKTGSRSARYTAPRLTRSSPGRVPGFGYSSVRSIFHIRKRALRSPWQAHGPKPSFAAVHAGSEHKRATAQRIGRRAAAQGYGDSAARVTVYSGTREALR